MATIPVQATGLRHVRKTINFDGGANNGNLGDTVPAFTGTGWYWPVRYTMRCTENMACTAPLATSMAFGIGDGTVNNIVDGVPVDGASGKAYNEDAGAWDDLGYTAFEQPKYYTGNLGVTVQDGGGGADVTDGTLIIDLWYFPVTDDGALAGDDIDTELVDAILDEVVEGSYTLRQLTRLMAAALLGELSGAATTTIAIRDASDTKTRITATVDGDGNRSALTLDAS